MKRTLLWFSLVLLGPGALWTAASPINDPQGVLDNFIAGIPITPEDAFTFHANLNGGGVFNFQNVSPEIWTALDFDITLPSNSLISCGPGPIYRTCNVQVLQVTGPTTVYEIGFDEPQNGIGIRPGDIFAVNLNDDINREPVFDPNGRGGWGSNASFNVLPTLATPEPAALGLLGLGAAGVLVAALRRRKRHSWSGAFPSA